MVPSWIRHKLESWEFLDHLGRSVLVTRCTKAQAERLRDGWVMSGQLPPGSSYRPLARDPVEYLERTPPARRLEVEQLPPRS